MGHSPQSPKVTNPSKCCRRIQFVAEQARRRGRWFSWLIVGCLAAGLGGYFWWRSLTAPLEHATLPTLVQDLKRARTESKGSINVYAYRMHHFLQEALVGQRWTDVYDQLQRQGAVHIGGGPSSASFELPDCGFDFPGGRRMKATIHVQREAPRPTGGSSDLRANYVNFDLSLEDPLKLKDPGTAFSAGSALSRQFRQADTVSALEKWPRVSQLTLSYMSDPKRVVAGALTVHIHLVPPVGLNDGGGHVMGRWNSGLEGNRKRPLPWLPLAFGTSRDSLEYSGGSSPPDNPGRTSYSLRRKDSPAENYKPNAEALSNTGLAAMPTDTESLSISPWSSRDLTSLPRLTKLKFVELQDVRAKDLTSIVALPKLERLYLSSTALPSLAILAKCPALADLTLNGAIADKSDVQVIAGMKQLKALRIYRRQPHARDLIAAIGTLPKLETLWFSQVEVLTGDALRIIAKSPNLKNLFLNVKGVPTKELAALGSLSKLETLRLNGASFDEAAIERLASLKSLSYLRISASEGLGGDRILAFAKLPNLRSIEFYQCAGVKDAALMKLKSRLGAEFEEEPGQ